VDENTQIYRLVANLDPQIKAIPSGCFNFICRKVVSVALNLIADKAKKLPQAYFDRMEERKEFYD
jgi:hypothetical protein